MRWVLAVLLAVALETDGAELFVAVGDSGLRLRSIDGQTWDPPQRWANAQDPLTALAAGYDRFIAAGGTATTGHLLSSTDGRQWRELNVLPKKVAAIAFGQSRFVAAQGPQLLVSTDGETFTSGDRVANKAPARATGIACGDTEAGFRFVIIGEAEPFPGETLDYWRAVTSDGSRLDSCSPQPRADAIAYGAGHFVVVGPHRIESSHDGQNWTLQPCPGDSFRTVVWTGARFLAPTTGAIWTSADALTWRRERTFDAVPLLYARDRPSPIALGWDPRGLLIISTDFRIWKVPQPDLPLVRAVVSRPWP